MIVLNTHCCFYLLSRLSLIMSARQGLYTFCISRSSKHLANGMDVINLTKWMSRMTRLYLYCSSLVNCGNQLLFCPKHTTIPLQWKQKWNLDHLIFIFCWKCTNEVKQIQVSFFRFSKNTEIKMRAETSVQLSNTQIKYS